MSLLDVRDLSVVFQRRGERPFTAVDKVSFTVEPGQTVGLVGESGCGKSVTSLAIMGLLPKRGNKVTGEVLFEGADLLKLRRDDMRDRRGRDIGMIFQDPLSSLNPVIPIGVQVAEVLERHQGRDRKQALREARELLEAVGIPDPDRRLKEYPHQISGGMRQRALIAIALACKPRLLIADEPTTALDVTVQAGILDLLRDLRTRLDMAVLLITHDMGVVADLADDVVVLREGRLVEKAPVAQLFANPGHEYTRALLHAVPQLPELRLPGAASAEPREPEPSAKAPAPRPATATSGEPAVRVRDLVVEYPGRRRGRRFRAVDGVCLDIAQGEVVGLVGESGSGKSTIGRALAGLVPVTAGTVQVVGVDVTRAAARGAHGREL